MVCWGNASFPKPRLKLKPVMLEVWRRFGRKLLGVQASHRPGPRLRALRLVYRACTRRVRFHWSPHQDLRCHGHRLHRRHRLRLVWTSPEKRHQECQMEIGSSAVGGFLARGATRRRLSHARALSRLTIRRARSRNR